MELVTIQQAKEHLRLSHAYEEDLWLKVDQATAIVLDYITRPDPDWTAEMDAWTVDTVPPSVQAAILLQVGELYMYRGDMDAIDRPHGDLAPGVVALLYRYRDPVIA